MELRHLRYFTAVADELSFTKAARLLRVAQPALSRQIRQLEDELGVQLLERDHHRVRLTEAGRAFRTEAAALLDQSEAAIRVARHTGAAGSSQLNVAYIWGLFHSLVPPFLDQFRRRFPATAVHLFDLTPMDQARRLIEGRLDAGFIGFVDEASQAGLERTRVGVCSFVAVLPQGHRAARPTRVALETLAGEFFLGISEETYPGASRHVTEACQQAGFRPRVLQMVERGYTILGLVAAGCGVALVPESLRALPHVGLVFRPLAVPVTADLFLAWNPKAPRPAREEFLRLVSAGPGRGNG